MLIIEIILVVGFILANYGTFATCMIRYGNDKKQRQNIW